MRIRNFSKIYVFWGKLNCILSLWNPTDWKIGQLFHKHKITFDSQSESEEAEGIFRKRHNGTRNFSIWKKIYLESWFFFFSNFESKYQGQNLGHNDVQPVFIGHFIYQLQRLFKLSFLFEPNNLFHEQLGDEFPSALARCYKITLQFKYWFEH